MREDDRVRGEDVPEAEPEVVREGDGGRDVGFAEDVAKGRVLGLCRSGPSGS